MPDVQQMLRDIATQSMAQMPANVADDALASREDVFEKLFEPRTFRFWIVGSRAKLADEVFPPVFSELACPQVNRAIRTVQQERILIEVSRQDRNALLGLGQIDHRLEPCDVLGRNAPFLNRLELG